MQTTIEFLDHAIQTMGVSQRALSTALGFSSTALSVQRKRGHLTPAAALLLADRLKADRERWAAIATMESETDPTIKTALRRALSAMQKS